MPNMATAMASSDFEGWLSEKLEKLNIDHEIFGSYITGIMESDDSTDEDKTEALTDILSEISGSVEDVCQEIFQQWNKTNQQKIEQQNNVKLQNKEDTEAKMASIMEKHATTQEVKKELSTEGKERKAALVAKYGQVSESDESEDEVETVPNHSGEAVNKNPKAATNHTDLLAPNTNAAGVVKQQQEQREKNKQAHAKRREMEKTQREEQLQKSQDRKDKEKKRTQKQERKR